MDRILYKEADGDITCRSRDFDKIFPTLYAYEETGLTPEQIVAMKGLHTARQDLIAENEKLKADLEWAKNYLRDGGGCAGCRHEERLETEEPCCHCQRVTLLGDDKWEFRGGRGENERRH